MPGSTIIDLTMLPQVSNTAFFPLFLCKDRYLFLFGGAGSGKSFYAAEKILVRILKAAAEGRVHRFLCLRKTQPSARKSILALFREYINNWGLAEYAVINKSDMTIKLLGSEIIITGMDDPEKIKSIHGITGVWLEETTEFTYDDFKQVDLRLRGITKDYKQIIMTFNPIDEQHWIRRKLFTDELQAEIESGVQIVRRVFTATVEKKEISYGMTVMHSTYKDNKFIDDMYKARLERLVEEDTNYHRIYTLGMWGVLKGLIFEHWEITKEWPEKSDEGGLGLDFGYSVDPSALVEVAFVGKDLYVREHLYEPKLTNPQIANKLKPVIEVAEHSLLVADCAEPKSIAEIRQAGIFILPCVKGADSINNGIQKIKQYNLLVDYNSPNLIKELQGYKWAENKDGTFKNKPVDFLNHLIDPLRYIVTKIKGATVSLDIIDRDEEKKTYFDEAGFKTHDAPVEMQDVDNPAFWNDDDSDDF